MLNYSIQYLEIPYLNFSMVCLFTQIFLQRDNAL